jgi:hypothetical protein
MNVNDLKAKKRVRVANLYDPPGILAMPEYLKHRRADARGVLTRQVPGHEGCWWVRQDDGNFAPYWFHELELDTAPPPPPFGSGRPFGD